MYFVVATGCNKIVSFIVCFSTTLEKINAFLEKKLETSIDKLKKYNENSEYNSDEDIIEVPFEFSEIDFEKTNFLGSYVLSVIQWSKIYRDRDRCLYHDHMISIFKIDNEIEDTVDMIEFMDKIQII